MKSLKLGKVGRLRGPKSFQVFIFISGRNLRTLMAVWSPFTIEQNRHDARLFSSVIVTLTGQLET